MNLNIVKSFVKKEFKQIIRDPSSILIAFVLPLILLVLFGFGINFDTNTIKAGIVSLDNTRETREVIEGLLRTRFLECSFYKTTNEALKALDSGKIRGYVVFPVNFTKELKKGGNPEVQIIADGSEPNTAKFVSSYVQGGIQKSLLIKGPAVKNQKPNAKISVIERVWYNPSLKSVYFILPGSLAIIMTMTGCVLTALVIAREWERGTMEAVLTTELTRGEFLLSKYIAYFVLGFLSITFCLLLIIFVFRVPFRGSYIWLFVTSSLFMLTGLGAGFLVSTVTKDQFVASQMAGTIGFMPSLMLSGLIYEIDSMPFFIRMISYIIPAKYYVSSVTTLFLTGNVLKTLILNGAYMLIFSLLTFFVVYKLTKEGLE